MRSEPEPPISDPLLRADRGQRDRYGAPTRAPVGNSIRTLLAFAVLVAVGIGVWWWRRPADLAMELGGREWVITDVDGVPAVNGDGTASTFVLDGDGEVRGVIDCNVATGEWKYDPQRARLDIGWTTQTDLPCPDEWPVTFLPTDGDVSMGDGTVIVENAGVSVEAIAPVDHEPASEEELVGVWSSGDVEVEIGRRGLFRIGACAGDWSSAEEDRTIVVRFDELQRDDCDLDPRWRDETPIVPVLHDGSLYFRRDRSIFPLDRDIIRLDPTV